MCYQPLLAKPIIGYKRGYWRVTSSGHKVLDYEAERFCIRLNALQ